MQEEQKNFGVGIFGGLLPTGAKTDAERKREREEELGA
jgi:hypothetical protein